MIDPGNGAAERRRNGTAAVVGAARISGRFHVFCIICGRPERWKPAKRAGNGMRGQLPGEMDGNAIFL